MTDTVMWGALIQRVCYVLTVWYTGRVSTSVPHRQHITPQNCEYNTS